MFFLFFFFLSFFNLEKNAVIGKAKNEIELGGGWFNVPRVFQVFPRGSTVRWCHGNAGVGHVVARDSGAYGKEVESGTDGISAGGFGESELTSAGASTAWSEGSKMTTAQPRSEGRFKPDVAPLLP